MLASPPFLLRRPQDLAAVRGGASRAAAAAAFLDDAMATLDAVYAVVGVGLFRSKRLLADAARGPMLVTQSPAKPSPLSPNGNATSAARRSGNGSHAGSYTNGGDSLRSRDGVGIGASRGPSLDLAIRRGLALSADILSADGVSADGSARAAMLKRSVDERRRVVGSTLILAFHTAVFATRALVDNAHKARTKAAQKTLVLPHPRLSLCLSSGEPDGCRGWVPSSTRRWRRLSWRGWKARRRGSSGGKARQQR